MGRRARHHAVHRVATKRGRCDLGSPFVTVPNGQATYTIVDLSVPDATSVEYAHLGAGLHAVASAHRLSPIR